MSAILADVTWNPFKKTVTGTKLHNSGLAGFFHLVEETGLNPGLNRPGRNRFLPPEVEETGKKFENGWLSKYFPLQEAVILKTDETTAKMCWISILYYCISVQKFITAGKLWWLPGRNMFLPPEVEETGKKLKRLKVDE